MAKKQKLVVGNWKMDPETVGDAKSLFMAVRKKLGSYGSVEVVVAPPFPYLAELRKLSMGKRLKLGAQNVYHERGGAHTGEVSTPMLKSLGVSHVIVGHSERRAMGETDEAVNQKATLLLKEKLTPIICVGEKKRSDSGAHFEYVEAQLHRAFSGVAKAQVSRAVVAYEPVWAISSGDGRGQTATTADIREMKLFIQRVLADRYSRTTGMAVRVLYGGSVNADNAEELAREADVDGFLVGGASRKPADFLAIITATRTA